MPPNDKHPDEIAKEIELENREWLESLDYVYENQGPDRVRQLLTPPPGAGPTARCPIPLHCQYPLYQHHSR